MCSDNHLVINNPCACVCACVCVREYRFCLASSTIKVHLIVSVGEAMYLSLPRGELLFHSLPLTHSLTHSLTQVVYPTGMHSLSPSNACLHARSCPPLLQET